MRNKTKRKNRPNERAVSTKKGCSQISHDAMVNTNQIADSTIIINEDAPDWA
jgi:hypothetical protein